ncbi:MAG TPA: hypothetical protein VKY32_00350 [Flavobacterium sp.]|nr:hypothetical protein [Flavobacterium sp.]
MKNKLHFFKQVLETVSFDADLFAKELQKAKTYLLPYELEQLYKWVHEFVKNKPELSELNLAY